MLGMKVMRRCLVAVSGCGESQRISADSCALDRASARDAQAQFVLTLHACRDADAPLGGGDDEMLARRCVDVVHDVREAGSDISAKLFKRIGDDAVGLPVRAP